MQIQTVMMLTSEIECAELNTLRDDLTIIIPPGFAVDVIQPEGFSDSTAIQITRRVS